MASAMVRSDYSFAPGDWTVVEHRRQSPRPRASFWTASTSAWRRTSRVPEYLYLKKGDYQLEFRLDGFESQTVDVEARPGAQIRSTKAEEDPGRQAVRLLRQARARGRRPAVLEQGEGRAAAGQRPGRRPVLAGRGAAPPGDVGGIRPRCRRWNSRPDTVQALPDPAPPVSRKRRPFRRRGPGCVFRVSRATRLSTSTTVSSGRARSSRRSRRGLQVPPGQHAIVGFEAGISPASEPVDVAPGKTETVEITLEKS